MRNIHCLLFFTILPVVLFAQSKTPDSSSSKHGLRHALYINSMDEQLPLFNGKLHSLYSGYIDGIPYFQSYDWYTGSVIYDEVLYENISMRYDQIRDEVVIKREPSSSIFISLFSPRVQEFSFSGLKFVHLDDSTGRLSMPQGFYQQMVVGKLTAYLQEKKDIEERIRDNAVYYAVNTRHRYYIKKNQEYYYIGSLKDLLKLVNDRRKEVQAFISKSKWKFRKQPKQTIVSVAEFYNQL